MKAEVPRACENLSEYGRVSHFGLSFWSQYIVSGLFLSQSPGPHLPLPTPYHFERLFGFPL